VAVNLECHTSSECRKRFSFAHKSCFSIECWFL